MMKGFRGVGKKKPTSAKKGVNKLANSIAKQAEKMTPKKRTTPVPSQKSSDEEVDEIG